MQLSRVLRPPQYYLWQAADGQLQLSTPADAAAAAAAPPGGAWGTSVLLSHASMSSESGGCGGSGRGSGGSGGGGSSGSANRG